MSERSPLDEFFGWQPNPGEKILSVTKARDTLVMVTDYSVYHIRTGQRDEGVFIVQCLGQV